MVSDRECALSGPECLSGGAAGGDGGGGYHFSFPISQGEVPKVPNVRFDGFNGCCCDGTRVLHEVSEPLFRSSSSSEPAPVETVWSVTLIDRDRLPGKVLPLLRGLELEFPGVLLLLLLCFQISSLIIKAEVWEKKRGARAVIG